MLHARRSVGPWYCFSSAWVVPTGCLVPDWRGQNSPEPMHCQGQASLRSCTIGSHGYANKHTQAMQSSRFKSNMAIHASQRHSGSPTNAAHVQTSLSTSIACLHTCPMGLGTKIPTSILGMLTNLSQAAKSPCEWMLVPGPCTSSSSDGCRSVPVVVPLPLRVPWWLGLSAVALATLIILAGIMALFMPRCTNHDPSLPLCPTHATRGVG